MATFKVPTGIPGLDELLGGGLPRGRIILIVGGPGAGKTIMSAQFLFNGITKYGENGIFVSLEEAKHHFYREMINFGFDFNQLEKQKKFIFLDASPIRHMPDEVKIGKTSVGRSEFSIFSLVERIKTSAEIVNAKRIAIDPLTLLVFQYPDIFKRRAAILDLTEGLMTSDVTVLVTTELRRLGPNRDIDPEEYVAHGVITLQTLPIKRSSMRVIQVEKMREVAIDLQPRPYKITDKGLEVFPAESIFE
ncbi:MAG: ATPase domain-containing protein [Candidatus Bathyarchaeia archaeon]